MNKEKFCGCNFYTNLNKENNLIIEDYSISSISTINTSKRQI